jgi:hypothetical protein
VLYRTASAWFLLLACACASGGPKLVVMGQAEVELGSFPARKKRTATFRVRNAGDADLTIRRIRQTCGCFTVTISRTTLPPSGQAVVTAELIPESVSHRFRKTVYLHSSDPARKATRLRVSGEAIPTVEILPKKSIRLGHIPLGVPVKHPLRLRVHERGVKLGKPEIPPAADGLTAELSPVSGTANVPYNIPLQITFTPPPMPGHFSHEVTIPIASPEGCRPLTIKVSGESTRGQGQGRSRPPKREHSHQH